MKEFILSDDDGAMVERSGERKLLPNREQIDAIVDLEWLTQFQDDLLIQTTKIETDLEFRPGDEDWAARARGALTAHQICRKHVERRIRQLERGQKKASARGPANLEEKLRLKELRAIAHEKHQEEARQNKLARAQKNAEVNRKIREAYEQKKNNTIRIQIAETIKRANFAGHFMKAARAKCAPELFQELLDAAMESQQSAIAEMIRQDAPASQPSSS